MLNAGVVLLRSGIGSRVLEMAFHELPANDASAHSSASARDNNQHFGIVSSSAAPRTAYSRTARVIARPYLLPVDILTLSLALLSVVVDSYLTQSAHNPALFFAMRISVKNLFIGLACWGVWSALLWMNGLYRPGASTSAAQYLLRLLSAVGLCTAATFVALFFRNQNHQLSVPLFLFWITGMALMMLSRCTLYGFETLVRPHFRLRRRVLVVGTGTRAQRVVAELPSNRNFAYDLAGYIDDDVTIHTGNAPVLGDLSRMEDILMHEQIDEVFIALPIRSHYADIARVIELCEASGVQSQYLADFFSTSITKRLLSSGEDGSRITLQMVHKDYRIWFKTAFDLMASLFGLLLLSPLFLLIAIAIKYDSPGPVFFTQTRFGLNKRKFGMVKFRSMVANAEHQQGALEHRNEATGPVFKIKGDPRITPLGRFLRKSSLDELPQLWNVLVGEMSLVGPRPLPMRDVSKFSELTLMRRFSVRPGMTGLWQVTGRSDTSFESWFAKDLQYIDTWSLTLDAKILLMTLPAVLRGSGAS